MDYLNRLAEDKFNRLNKLFPVVLVCGPRQVGKTTMLKHLSNEQGRTYVTLDDLNVRFLAQNDPKLFFQTYKPPIIIDEIQFAPNLMSEIKLICDEHKINGEFWLTGSQSYNIMRGITESLAGRIGVLNMYSFTPQELQGNIYNIPTDFSFESLNHTFDFMDINSIFDYIFMGGMPRIAKLGVDERNDYFESYINSYLMRDVMELGKVNDIVKFNAFLYACSSQVANVVNYKNLALASNISEATAREWLEILQGMGIIYIVEPYYNNLFKRLTKTPKMYFYDLGLCAYLAHWPSRQTLQVSAMAGAYFENFVMNQFKIKYQLLSQAPNLFFYRDIDKNEVDIVLERYDGLIPLEIKLSANPDIRNFKKFDVLKKLNKTILNGGIICMIDKLMPIDEFNSLIPVSLL